MRVGLIGGLLLTAVVGCSGGGDSQPTGRLEGAVTFDGKPVANARVQVQSAETGAAAAAITDDQGHYRIPESLVIGKFAANVTPNDEAPPAGAEPAPSAPKERDDIPAKYRDPAKSGLTFTLEEGSNTFDIKMTPGG